MGRAPDGGSEGEASRKLNTLALPAVNFTRERSDYTKVSRPVAAPSATNKCIQ